MNQSEKSTAKDFRHLLPLIKLFFVPIIWGVALTAGRVVTAELPALTTTCIRFAIASLIMVPALYLKEGRFPRLGGRDFLWLILLSVLGMVMFNFFLFSSLRTITAVRSSVMLAFTPSIVTLLAFFVFKESITPLKTMGIVLAFIGAVLTITNGNVARVIKAGFSEGDLFMIGAVLSWAAYSIVAKFAMTNLTPLTLLAYGSVLGVVMLFPISLFEGAWSSIPALSGAALGSLAYLGIGAAGIAYLWYYEGINAVGSSKASVFMNLEPVAAIAAGVLVLNEEFSGVIALGAFLVMAGLVLTNYRRRQKRVNPPTS